MIRPDYSSMTPLSVFHAMWNRATDMMCGEGEDGSLPVARIYRAARACACEENCEEAFIEGAKKARIVPSYLI